MVRIFDARLEKSQTRDTKHSAEVKLKENRTSRRFLGGLAVLAAVGAMGLSSSKQNFSESSMATDTQSPTAQIDKNSEYSFSRLSGERGGAWSFFGDARSIRVNENIYTGWIALKGFVQISQYNTDTHKRKTVTLGPNLGRLDDHNNPSLLARKDGRIMAFYSPHSGRSLPKHGVSRMYYRTTKKPDDITKWGPIHHLKTNSPGSMGYTYPNPVSISDGKVWMGWRGGNWQPTSSITPDHGKSWTKARTFLKSGGKKRPYVKYAEGPNDSVIMTYNQDNPGTTGTGLYYLQYRPGKGYFRADGEKVAGSNATIPVSKGDMIMSKHRRGRLYTMDVAADEDGNPATVFTAKPRRGSASVYYSKWNGKHWKTEKVASTGYGLYSKKTKPRHYGFYPTAGASLDHDDTSTVYLSRQVDHQMRVEKWEHKKPGEWDHQTISPKEKSCVRPASVRNDIGKSVVMMCGDYTNWLKFRTSIYIATPRK